MPAGILKKSKKVVLRYTEALGRNLMLKHAAVLVAGLVGMGGWAVVTVKDVPEYYVAGQQYTLEFQVRQHGHYFLDDLHPELLLSSPGTADGRSILARNRGHGSYAVTFTAPQTGPLSLTIKSGFGASDLRLYPAAVVARGVSPPPMALAERGRMLFVAKGCNVCHTNSDLTDRPDNQQIKVGPELGGRQLPRDYVIQMVQKPSSQIMPDLGLSDAEAAAIATFLNEGAAAATAGNR
jgi:hypothetical protein